MTSGLLVIHNKTEMATIVCRLFAPLLEGDELIAEIDEGHPVTFTTQLEFEQAPIKESPSGGLRDFHFDQGQRPSNSDCCYPSQQMLLQQSFLRSNCLRCKFPARSQSFFFPS
jgi:hypothetical protein